MRSPSPKSIILAVALAAIAACSESTGPSDPASYVPQFTKTAQDGLGTGGGGGGSGSACEYPTHMSGQCVSKGLQAAAGFFGMLGTCKGGFNAFCAGAATANGAQWNDFANTPDADGHTHTLGPNEYFGGPLYPIGGPGW